MAGLLINFGANVKTATAGIKEVSLTLKEQQGILQKLRYEYSYLDATQRKSAFGKTMAADIRIASAEIANIKANATSGFGAVGSGATKALSGLRTLAYVLPGLGIAGIFNIAFDALGRLFSGMDSAKSHFQNFAEAFSGAKDKFVDATKNIFELRTEIDLARQGFISQEGVVNHYNETIGKTTGIVKSLDEAEAGLIANSDAYIEMTLRKAVAQVAYGKAAEKAFQIEENWQKMIELSGQKILILGVNAVDIITNKLSKKNKILQESVDLYKKIGDGALKAAADAAKGFDFFGGGGGTKSIPAEKFIPKFPKLKAPISIDFLIDQKNIKFVLLGGENKSFKQQVEDSINKDIEKLVIKPNFKTAAAPISDAMRLGADTAAAFNEGFKNMASEGLSSIGEGIGDALAGGDVKSAFAAFGQTLGSAISAIGKQIIAIGVAAILAKKALTILFENPFVAVAAGIALVAAGQALRSVLGRGLPGRATGGPVAANQPYLVGERRAEIFVPSTSGRILPTTGMGMQGTASPVIIFNGRLAVSGNKLQLLLNRTDRYNNSNV